MKKTKELGFMELLDCALDSVQHVRDHSDYDWIRKYGNLFISQAIDSLVKAMEVNNLPTNTKDI